MLNTFIDTLNKLCSPAFLYAVIHIVLIALSVLGALSKGAILKPEVFSAILLNMIGVAIFVYFLNFLCRKGFGTISWILVLAPFVIMLAFVAAEGKKGRKEVISLFNPNPMSAST